MLNTLNLLNILSLLNGEMRFVMDSIKLELLSEILGILGGKWLELEISHFSDTFQVF